MSWSGSVFDIALAVVVVWLAARSLEGEDLFKSVALFVVFGFLTALAWTRLGAPDIALADALIGAGITGALLLDAFGHFEKHRRSRGERREAALPDAANRPSHRGALGVTAVCLALFVLLARAVLSISESDYGLAPLVAENLDKSGVPSAVTAVLLNFRGYDTLLEISVLVLATIGVLSLRSTEAARRTMLTGPADPVLSFMTRMLVPVMVLIAGYLLWAGEHAPGGAFQAGSVLGGAAVLLALSGYRRPGWLIDFRLRLAIVIGFLVFLLVSVAPIAFGGRLLEYPPKSAGLLMVFIESWLTLSIGTILASLFLASAAPAEIEEEEEAGQ